MLKINIENVELLKAGNKMIDFVDKTEEKNGTYINRKNMMAIQGFLSSSFKIVDGEIIETNENNESLLTKKENGKIIEIFNGEKQMTKTTHFDFETNSIKEVIS